MEFGEAIRAGFQNYATFTGRAVRSEFWYWVLFTLLGGIATALMDVVVFGIDGVDLFNTVFSLATLIPSIAVGVRRLHDIDRTGWWMLLMLTLIGMIVLIVWFCQKSDPGPNRYGENPLDTEPVLRSGAIPPQ